MSGKPYANVLIHHTIEKVKQHWEKLKENIQLPPTASESEAKWLAQIPYLKQLSFHNSLCIAVWNIFSNRFLFVIDERRITNYDLSLYTNESGVDFSLSNFHADHIHALHLINQCMSKHLEEYHHIPHDKLIANLDALYRINNGDYIHILQQIVPVETDSKGNPFLFLSYIRDITHIKKLSTASLVFTTPDESRFWRYNSHKRELEHVMPFSLQERKVLQLLCEGKQTKYIAEVLSLSPHTVDTHRRNMLAKTSCVDSTALVAYSQMIGIL